MGLVQNLKKKLNDWGDKVLVALSCHYIKHLAKQTSRKQNNSSSTTFSQNPLTKESPPTTIATSSAGTSAKTTMKKVETEDIVQHIRDWAIDIIEEKKGNPEDQVAIIDEFYEWISPKDELDIISLEDTTGEEYEDYIERG